MAKYSAVYRFEVLEKLRKGVEVYVLDRESGKTCCMSRLNVMSVLDVIDHNNDSDNRYEMWEVIDAEDGKTDE